MDKKYVLAIIGIAGGLIGNVVVLAMNDLKIFQAYPEFHIDQELWDSIHALDVENIGRVQAKNAVIDISGTDVVNASIPLCPEGIITQTDHESAHIKFNRMSTNVECLIKLKSNSDFNLISVAVTADDAPGLQSTFILTESQIQKGNTTGNIILNQSSSDFLFSIISIYTSIIAGLTIYWYYRRKRRLSILQQRQSEIETKLRNAQEELDYHEKRLVKEQNAPPQILERIRWLEEQVSQYSDDLDQVRSILSTDEGTHVLVGKFFTNWAILEANLMTLGEKYYVGVTKYPTIGSMIQSLHRNKIISSDFVEKFEPVKVFRNQIAHAIVKPSKSELEKKNEELDNLLLIVNKMMREKM